MARFALPQPPPFRPTIADPSDAAGEDVRFTDGLAILAGDWATLRGDAVAEQSVRREASHNSGAIMRRPDWGMGITQMMFKGKTKTNNDSLISRVRSRMRVNPRVGRFLSAELVTLSFGQGQAVIIRYEPVGTKMPRSTKIVGR